MDIVDRKTLATMPNGTLFCEYVSEMLTSNFYVITGHTDPRSGRREGFHSVLPLNPIWKYNNETRKITNWATIDTCDYDYDENDLFAVFSKTEIRAMITVLQYALSDCSFPISKFMDTYYNGDWEIDEKDIEDWD